MIFAQANNSQINNVDRLPSPFQLFFVCLVITILIMSFISRPTKFSACCNCWKTGIPPVWLVCIGLVIVQVHIVLCYIVYYISDVWYVMM